MPPMPLLPPLPPWNGAHPEIVHFPIALLITAPIFVLLALFLPSRRKAFALSALILMGLGAIGAIVAVEAGEAGEENAKRIPAAIQTLHEHQELGERTRNVFIALTIVFGVTVVAERRLARALPAIYVAFLVLYMGGLLVLVNAAHRGGLLVHYYGAHAPIRGAPAAASTGSPPGAAADDGD
jgi:uncharacterized membrane protein